MVRSSFLPQAQSKTFNTGCLPILSLSQYLYFLRCWLNIKQFIRLNYWSDMDERLPERTRPWHDVTWRNQPERRCITPLESLGKKHLRLCYMVVRDQSDASSFTKDLWLSKDISCREHCNNTAIQRTHLILACHQHQQAEVDRTVEHRKERSDFDQLWFSEKPLKYALMPILSYGSGHCYLFSYF